MKKRVTAAILAAGMILSLAGCHGRTGGYRTEHSCGWKRDRERERDRERDPHRCGSYGERSRASGFN